MGREPQAHAHHKRVDLFEETQESRKGETERIRTLNTPSRQGKKEKRRVVQASF